VKKRKKIEKYGKRNILSKLSNRFLDKDLAKYLEISKTSFYRYKTGIRKIPASILSNAEILLSVAPKKTSKKRKLLKKRFKKIEHKLKNDIIELSTKTTEHAIKTKFLYEGNYKDIFIFILKLQEKYADGDNVVYRIIREKFIEGKKVIDSTYMYALHAINKLEKNFKKILSKYASHASENDKFLEKIYVERTEMI